MNLMNIALPATRPTQQYQIEIEQRNGFYLVEKRFTKTFVTNRAIGARHFSANHRIPTRHIPHINFVVFVVYLVRWTALGATVVATIACESQEFMVFGMWLEITTFYVWINFCC